MMWFKLYAFVFYTNLCRLEAVKLDVINCGADETDTKVGAVMNRQYPWLGVLFYSLYGGLGETRSVTTVVLIHTEFVLANSADIGPMPKRSFRDKARVLLGEGWERGGRRVRNYILHPEYGETINSVAIVHLRQPVRDHNLKPICPPPDQVRSSNFWIVKFENQLERLKKLVLPAAVVPATTCRHFYESRNLGLSVHGPGCGAPARFLDMKRYYPWIEDSLDKFQRITISQINQHKYVLRSGVAFGTVMRFGDCDDYEKKNLIYRDAMELSTDNHNVKLIKYNMTIYDSVQYTCVVFILKHASATAELRVRHFCPRGPGGAACYAYRGTRFDVSVDVQFTEGCTLEVRAYGLHVNMSLLDIELWKWEEGTYYEDFRLTPTEYRGPVVMTQYGFEPLDERMWVPDYDRWSTTPFDWHTTTVRYTQVADDYRERPVYPFVATPAQPTTTKRWLKWFSKKTQPPENNPWYWAEVAMTEVGNYLGGVVWRVFTVLVPP